MNHSQPLLPLCVQLRLIIIFHQPFAQVDLVGLNIHPSSTPTILYVFLMCEYEARTCDVEAVVDARYNLVVHIHDLGPAQEDGGLCLKTGFAGTSSLRENGVKFVGLDIFLAKLGTASVRPNFPIRVERKLVQLACSTMRTWPVAPFRDNFISTRKTNETRIFHGSELLDGTSPPLTTRPTDCAWGSMTHIGDLGDFGLTFWEGRFATALA